MIKRILRRAGVPVLALTLVLWGCENAGQLTGPGEVSRITSISDGSNFNRIKETDGSAGLASATIGTGGGKIWLGRHSLTVPAGAVDGPTVFSMARSDSTTSFKLTATRVTTNDIGAAGFLKPVTLTINYSKAEKLPSDQSKLKVYWKKLDGTLEAQPTVNRGVATELEAQLSHFSEYAGGWLTCDLDVETC